MAGSQTASPSLLSLPDELLVLLTDYVHNIEDFTNLSGTCARLRACLSSATPNTILRLAAAQSRVFFQPSPHFLLLAVSRELGHWARRSRANEAQFAAACALGVEGLLSLSLEHCGLTLDRIRSLHLARFDIINPVTDAMDKCVGEQWYATPDFWNGGVSDAYTIHGEPAELFFHLAIYGEIFGPELESFVEGDADAPRLSVDTRLEFVKYCIPDWGTISCTGRDLEMEDGTIDPRRRAGFTGPYEGEQRRRLGEQVDPLPQQKLALIWVLQSSRWRPYWEEVRRLAGTENFMEGFRDEWLDEPESSDRGWRQRLWENVMVCQGLEGLGMMRPQLREAWCPKIREWRDRIQNLRGSGETITVGRLSTQNYPYLMGDLRILISGYVPST